MTSPEIIAAIAVAISFVTLVAMLTEKIWGSGRNSASQFNSLHTDMHRMELDFTNRMVAMREEMNSRIDTGIENTRVGINAILANQHALEKSVLEFRNIIAEAGYIKRTEFTAVIDNIRAHSDAQARDIKKDLDAGFRTIESRINQIVQKD